MRNMYNFHSELWLIKSPKTAACKEREGEENTELVQLVAQSAQSLFIQFPSVSIKRCAQL